MRKLTLLIALLLLTPLISSAQYKVGVGVPLTADGAWMGENVLKGIKLYLKQEGIPFDSSVVVEDVSFAQTKTTAGISAVRRLGERDGVSAMILCNSPVVSASATFIDERKIPTVAIVAGNTASNRTHQVRMWPPPQDEMMALVEQARGKKVALLYSEQESMIVRKVAFEEKLQSQGTLVYSSAVDIDTINAVSLKVHQAKPDVVVLFLMPGKNGLVAKRLREMNYTGLFAGSAVINSEEEVVLSHGALLGAMFPDTFMTDEFVKAFQNEYGQMPGVGSAPGYDAAKLVFQELREANGDAHKVNQGLHTRNFSGAMGEYGLLDDTSNCFQIPVVMRKVAR
jgi:ABC-type branched-subunit amino acid transport system substrate-binding protein